MMLGIVMFGYALMATAGLTATSEALGPRHESVPTAPAGHLLVVGGATLYMILGGLSLGRASQEHSRLREMALVGQLEACAVSSTITFFQLAQCDRGSGRGPA